MLIHSTTMLQEERFKLTCALAAWRRILTERHTLTLPMRAHLQDRHMAVTRPKKISWLPFPMDDAEVPAE